jgi:hypothetical protein
MSRAAPVPHGRRPGRKGPSRPAAGAPRSPTGGGAPLGGSRGRNPGPDQGPGQAPGGPGGPDPIRPWPAPLRLLFIIVASLASWVLVILLGRLIAMAVG